MKYKDSAWLRKKYVEERLSTSDIGDICGVTKETIRRWLDNHGIDTRSQSEATKVEWENDPEREVPEDFKGSPGGEEHPMYGKDRTAEHWKGEKNPVHDREQTGEDNHMHGVTGEKHPRWNGGTSGFDPEIYGRNWYTEVRPKVIERDEVCQVCGVEKESPHVHHIEPARSFDSPSEANEMDNLILLCAACHAKVENGKHTIERAQ
jgi:hypothetical protein